MKKKNCWKTVFNEKFNRIEYKTQGAFEKHYRAGWTQSMAIFDGQFVHLRFTRIEPLLALGKTWSEFEFHNSATMFNEPSIIFVTILSFGFFLSFSSIFEKNILNSSTLSSRNLYVYSILLLH